MVAMHFSIARPLAAMIALLCAPVGCVHNPTEKESNAVAPISKLDVQRGSPEWVKQQVVAQFSDILLDEKFYQNVELQRPLEDLSFFTVPTSANTFDVCRKDLVIFQFESEAPENAEPSTPARVKAIHATTSYNVGENASIEEILDLEDKDRAQLSAKCKKLDSFDDHWIKSDREEYAIEGIITYRNIFRTSDEELRELQITCDLLYPEESRPCTEIIRTIPPEQIYAIERCDVTEGNLQNLQCLRASAGGYWINMYNGYRSKKMSRRIHIQGTISLIHERIE